MMTYKIAVSSYKLDGKIPQGSDLWTSFNSSFVNFDIEQKKIMAAVYRGRSITTQHKNNWRTSENYICGQHIGLDFDTGDEDSSFHKLSRDKFISKYASFLYTTISHKPESPRSRVIFLLEQPIMQAKNYTMAVTALLWLFGTADRQCKDAVRFFYGSPGCEFHKIDQILPLEVIKKIIQNYKDSGTNERKLTIKKNYLAPASQQEVQDALKLIPPWGIAYDEWVQVLMGIHSEFGDAGYNLAESWGDGKQGEVERKWRSFHDKGSEGSAVTIATLFSIAKRFGWVKSHESLDI